MVLLSFAFMALFYLRAHDTLFFSSILVKPKLPENFEEETWTQLQQAVRAVHNKAPVSSSLEELYKVTFGIRTSNTFFLLL